MKPLTNPRKRHFHHLLTATAVSLSLLLNGCGGGSSESTETVSEKGDLYISLTDATGDFSSYTVDVTAISLVKANGVVVETLPLETRIDFAQYVEMTEFLTAATIPTGRYVEGELTLDYANAEIWVENELGEPVQVSADNLRDEAGNPVTTMEMSISLDDSNQLLIARGLPSHLTLDFDLNASHQTTFDSGDPVVTISPVLLADIDLEKNKPHRVRGPLQSVDLADSSYQLFIRPGHHKIGRDNNGRFGTLKIDTTEETAYQIDGESYQGLAGLQALADKEKATATIAMGNLLADPRRFEATEVYAGSSVPGGSQDVIQGSVIARDGNQLTVRGSALIRNGGPVRFRREITVSIGNETQVKKQLSSDSMDIDSISIGQNVRIFGELDNSNAEQPTLDASQGLVHLQLSTVSGTIASVDSELTMNLSGINRQRISLFDFAGTGVSSDLDADPNNYEVTTGSLDTSALNLNNSLKVRGFPTPFGSAPEDFEVHTLIDVQALPVVLVTDWVPATSGAISQLDSTAITLNLDGVGRFHHMSQAGVRIDLVELESAPQIKPDQDGVGRYSIRQDNAHAKHQSFDNFVSDLQTRLDAGATVKRLVAPGSYDSSATTITARRITIVLE